MRLGEALPSSIDRELAVLDDRLRAAQREAGAAMTAIGAIAALLAVVGGWAMV